MLPFQAWLSLPIMNSLPCHFNPLSIIHHYYPLSFYCPLTSVHFPCSLPHPRVNIGAAEFYDRRTSQSCIYWCYTVLVSDLQMASLIFMRLSYSLLSFPTVATGQTLTTIHKSPRLMNLPSLFTHDLVTYHTDKVLTPVESPDKSSLKVTALSPLALLSLPPSFLCCPHGRDIPCNPVAHPFLCPSLPWVPYFPTFIGTFPSHNPCSYLQTAPLWAYS